MDVRQIMKNISGGLVNYAAVILTGFFLTPFLLEKFGLAAFGLISLASVLVLCVDALREALNSMAGRYIMVSIHRGDPRAANAVFNSVLAANLCLIVPVGLFFIAAALFRGQIFRIPAGEERSFLWLLLLVGVTFLLKISSAPFAGSYFASGRLDVRSWVNTASKLLYIGLVLALLYGFRPQIYMVGAADAAAGLLTAVCGVAAWRRLTPYLKVDFRCFRFSVLKRVAASGSWNSLNNINWVLLNAADVYLANIYVPGQEGVVAIVKAFPGYILLLLQQLKTSFTPAFTKCHAAECAAEMERHLDLVSRLMIFAGSIPVAGMAVFGREFFRVWLPGQEAGELYWLTVISLVPYALSLALHYSMGIYVATDRLKVPSLAFLAFGAGKIVAAVALLGTTSLGLWAIIGVSAFFTALRDLGFHLYYLPRVLPVPRGFFVRRSLAGVGAVAALTLLFLGVKAVLPAPDGWLRLLLAGAVCGLLGVAVNYRICLGRSARAELLRFLRLAPKEGRNGV